MSYYIHLKMNSKNTDNVEIQHHLLSNDGMQQDDMNTGECNLQHELIENEYELKFYAELETSFMRGEYPSRATKVEKDIKKRRSFSLWMEFYITEEQEGL